MAERWISRLVFVLALLFVLLAGMTYYAKFHLKDKLVPVVLSELNKRLQIHIHIQDIDIRFLRTFPHASITLIEPVGMGHENCNLKDFPGNVSDTLFHFQRIDLRFNIRELLQKNYVMNRITLDKGSLQLLKDKNGQVNYTLFEGDTDETTRFELDLRNVTLSDVQLVYFDMIRPVHGVSSIDKLVLSGRFKQSQYTLKVHMEQTVHKLFIDEVPMINRPNHWNIASSLSVKDSVYTFDQTKFTLNNIDFSVNGTYTHSGTPEINLEMKAENVETGDLLGMIPENYKKDFPAFKTSGMLGLHIVSRGTFTKTRFPLLQAHFSLEKGTLQNRDIKIEELTFQGSLTNGSQRNLTSTTINIEKFSFHTAKKSHFQGSARVENLKSPVLQMDIKTSIDLQEVQKFIHEDYQLQGIINMDTRFKSRLRGWNEWDKNNFYYITLDSRIVAENFAMQYKHLKIEKGDFSVHWFDNNILVETLYGKVNQAGFSYQGDIRNATYALFRDKQPLHFYGNITGEHLDINKLIPEQENEEKTGFHLPDNLFLDLNCQFKQFSVMKFIASNITGTLQYEPHTGTLKNLTAQTLDGNIAGEGYFSKEENLFHLTSNTELKNINIEKLFKTFDAFGQEHLTHENIAGDLSGNIQFTSDFDTLLTVQTESIQSIAKIVIENGALHDFEMLYSLSRFIDLEELRDIRFERLENRLEINNSQLIIPRMEVHSSAVEMEASGTHDFENTYQYHISVLLSDVLSRKARRKKENTEFGVIADDGVRTMLHLKIEGKDKEYNVSYDRQRAVEKVRENLKEERQELRELFREEFGRKKSTETTKEKDDEFIIEWEEEDENEQEEVKEKSSKQNKTEEKKFIIEWE